MDFARLFGRRYRTDPMPTGLAVRSVTVDLEVLTDALDMATGRWRSAGTFGRIKDEFRSPKGEVEMSDLDGLSVSDRNGLVLTRSIEANERSASIFIDCQQGRIGGSGLGDQETVEAVADYIVRNGTSRPTWVRMKFLLPLAVLLLMVVGYLGFIFTQELNLFAHILLLALILAAGSGMIVASKSAFERSRLRYGSIRVRGQSRKDTNAERANRHANLRLAAITIPSGAALGVIGTLVTKAITGE